MTRKDYVCISDAIREAKTPETILAPDKHQESACIIYGIALALKADNPRFDMPRFLKACEVTR